MSAVAFTLCEHAAKGSATTNAAEPSTVAIKHPGRTSATSAMLSSALSFARLTLTLPKLMARMHRTIQNFFIEALFIYLTFILWRLVFKLFVFGEDKLYLSCMSHKSARIAVMIKSFQGRELDAHYF